MGERFRDVVVGADLQPHHLVRFGVPCRDHDDRDIAAGPEPAAHLRPGHSGQHQIQQNQVRAIAVVLGQAAFAISLGGNVETFLVEHVGESLTIGLFVLDDQNPGHPLIPPGSPRRRPSPGGPEAAA